MTEPTKKRGRGRPRKATPVATGEGYSVRTYVVIDGVEVRQQVALGTTSKVVARAKVKAIEAGKLDPLAARRAETFELAARRVVAAQRFTKERYRRNRLSRLERFAFPVLGKLSVDKVDAPRIKDVIADVIASAGGKVTSNAKHVFDDVSSVLASLKGDNLVHENAARRIPFAQTFGSVESVRLPPIMLSDDEFVRFARHHLAKPTLDEVVVLAMVSRFLGGMRTSDLHAWSWEHIDTKDWRTAFVPRPKTKKDPKGASRHALDSDLVPVLERWWAQHHRPVRGPVFPIRRDGRGGTVVIRGRSVERTGLKAGSRKRGEGVTYAPRLRALVWAAGVVRPMPGFESAATDAERRALCEIQSGGEENSPLDFHSFRRATATAAGRMGEELLPLKDAMALVDHSDVTTHLGYRRAEKVLVTPKQMLPAVGTAGVIPGSQGILARDVPKMAGCQKEKVNDSGHAHEELNLGPTAPEGVAQVAPEPFSRGFRGSEGDQEHQETPSAITQRQKQTPIFRSALATLREAAQQAVAEGSDELAEALLAVLKKHAAPPRASVTPIGVARRGKGE